MVQPPIEVIALNRLAFGPRPGDVESLAARGLATWLDETARAEDARDDECNARLKSARLRIAYDAGKDHDKSWDKVEEDRPLRSLWTSRRRSSGRWPTGPSRCRMRSGCDRSTRCGRRRGSGPSTAGGNSARSLVDFWHNHFNVNANVDAAPQVTFPAYDREVIRKHCLATSGRCSRRSRPACRCCGT
jgi:uncharacterized protein (DUF1800 family)